MEDNYLLEEDGDSYYICFRNVRRAERLRKIRQREAWGEEESRSKRNIDVSKLLESIGYLLVSLTIFTFPFWMILAGAVLEKLGW